MPDVVLYGHPESGHSYKVALALTFAGVPHEYRFVDVFVPRERRRPDFLSVSPFGEVPVLVDAGVVLAQSNAILLHIARRSGLLGGETEARYSEARQWLFWEANRIGFSLANLRSQIRFEKDPVPEVSAWLRSRFELDVARLGQAVSARPFLLGDSLSVADISCSAYLFFAREAGIDVGRWPSVERWLARIASEPGFRTATDLMKP